MGKGRDTNCTVEINASVKVEKGFGGQFLKEWE